MLSQLLYVLALPFTWLNACMGVSALWSPMSGYLWGCVLVAGMFTIYFGLFPRYSALFVLQQGILPFIAGDFFRVFITVFVIVPWRKMAQEETKQALQIYFLLVFLTKWSSIIRRRRELILFLVPLLTPATMWHCTKSTATKRHNYEKELSEKSVY